MQEAFAICPECGKNLTYCPELKHRKSGRVVFRCETIGCMVSTAHNENRYFVLGNVDNFGQTVHDYEKAFKD